jgi:hypothetical protein
MSKKKPHAPTEETAIQPPETSQSPAEASTPPALQETAASESALPQTAYTPVMAPEKLGRASTVDNRIGYRKEISTETGNEQIRFNTRPDGSRPDDELLATVRGKKPDVKYQAREQSWQARTQKGVDAIDDADAELADIGRRRSQGQSR